MDSWRELALGALLALKAKIPVSAPIALGSAALYGLDRLAPRALDTILLVLFVLAAVLAAGVGLIEAVAQDERSRLLAFAAAAYGVIATIFTFAHAIAGMLQVHQPSR